MAALCAKCFTDKIFFNTPYLKTKLIFLFFCKDLHIGSKIWALNPVLGFSKSRQDPQTVTFEWFPPDAAKFALLQQRTCLLGMNMEGRNCSNIAILRRILRILSSKNACQHNWKIHNPTSTEFRRSFKTYKPFQWHDDTEAEKKITINLRKINHLNWSEGMQGLGLCSEKESTWEL